jgi:hypothetical protein
VKRLAKLASFRRMVGDTMLIAVTVPVIAGFWRTRSDRGPGPMDAEERAVDFRSRSSPDTLP